VLYQELLGRLALGEKIIIFCPAKDDYEFLSRELGILCYYSNKEDKELILRRFKSDLEVTTIARTTALGVGIDLPGIRFLIHLYKISSLIAFDQEVGRIGRDS
jgi:superfamily II DNA helicase RecQ